MKYLFLILFLPTPHFCFADTLPSAEQIMNEASIKARKENKKILLMFTASWCVWCKKMDKSIEDPACKKFFDENYVIIHLNVQESDAHLENPGAMDVLKKFKGDESGIPFWVFLDADLNLLADSYIRKPGVSKDEVGENIGCPASEEEVEAFITILKQTARVRLSDLDAVSKRFRKNKV